MLAAQNDDRPSAATSTPPARILDLLDRPSSTSLGTDARVATTAT
jgi:hypothetical protein